MEDNIRLARDLLFGEEVLNDAEAAPVRVAEAQAFATIAVAEAIARLAAAVDALHS